MKAKVKKEKVTSSQVEYADAFEKCKEILRSSQRILLSTHLLPDGDGLGAETALYHYLKRARKNCRIYNPDLLPKRYRFLDPKSTFLHGPGEVEIWDIADVWVIVDTNDPRRVGPLWNQLCNRARKIIFLDHHQPLEHASSSAQKIDYPAHCLMVSDPASSCIGELLHRLFSDLNLATFNQDIALGLYVSVMTDTNSFRYSGTTPQAHRIAADMIELGVNPEETYQAIYSSKDLSHVQLLGKMLERAATSSDGKIAWMSMSAQLRKEHHATSDDTMSFLNLLLLIRDAEVVCLFREEDDSRVRISIKSKGRLIVNAVASALGGGGHEYAAGALSQESLATTQAEVIRRLQAALATQKI